jgi:hypothetical protein
MPDGGNNYTNHLNDEEMIRKNMSSHKARHEALYYCAKKKKKKFSQANDDSFQAMPLVAVL